MRSMHRGPPHLKVKTIIVVAVIGFSRGQAKRSRDRDLEFGSTIPRGFDHVILRNAFEMLREGKQTCPFDTFGVDDCGPILGSIIH